MHLAHMGAHGCGTGRYELFELEVVGGLGRTVRRPARRIWSAAMVATAAPAMPAASHGRSVPQTAVFARTVSPARDAPSLPATFSMAAPAPLRTSVSAGLATLAPG
jgi:hypothetical protein